MYGSEKVKRSYLSRYRVRDRTINFDYDCMGQ